MSNPNDQVLKGLKHLKGSDEVIGKIVAWCANTYKADPSPATLQKVRQYVSDTANSVSEHVLTIAHNLNRLIDAEVREIQDITYQTGYVAHRLKIHQKYMSELYMTKFQTYPRPRATIHIKREIVPVEQLPKYAKPKKPWIRKEGNFNYSILDQVGARNNTSKKTTTSNNNEGEQKQNQTTKSKNFNTIAPKAAVPAFNPYESMNNSNNNNNNNTNNKNTNNSNPNISIAAPSSPKGISLYQQQKRAKQVHSPVGNSSANAAPPTFSSAVAANAAPPTFSSAVKENNNNKSKSPPVPPPVPANVNKVPPPVPPVPPPVPK